VAPSFVREVGKRPDATDLSSTSGSLTSLGKLTLAQRAVRCSPHPVDRVAHRMLRLTGRADPRASGGLGHLAGPLGFPRATFISSVLRLPTVYSYRQEQGLCRWRKRATRVGTCR
jgi:hypothetical protein